MNKKQTYDLEVSQEPHDVSHVSQDEEASDGREEGASGTDHGATFHRGARVIRKLWGGHAHCLAYTQTQNSQDKSKQHMFRVPPHSKSLVHVAFFMQNPLKLHGHVNGLLIAVHLFTSEINWEYRQVCQECSLVKQHTTENQCTGGCWCLENNVSVVCQRLTEIQWSPFFPIITYLVLKPLRNHYAENPA